MLKSALMSACRAGHHACVAEKHSVQHLKRAEAVETLLEGSTSSLASIISVWVPTAVYGLCWWPGSARERMLTRCMCASMQSLQAGGSLKQLVALVGGSTSGFTNIIAAYVATFTVTIAVSVICLGLAIAMYSVRTDQKLRRDLRYGGARRCMPDVARGSFFLLCMWAALHALQQLYWPVHTTCLRHSLQGHHSLRSVWALLWPCRPHTPTKHIAKTCSAELFLP